MPHVKEYAIANNVITKVLIVLKIVVFSLCSFIKIFFSIIVFLEILFILKFF